MADLRQLRFTNGKPLAELTDAELEQELRRRRAARQRRQQLNANSSAAAAANGPTASSASAILSGAAQAKRPGGGLLIRREVKQYLKNLELEPGASIDAIREKYFQLREKYDPRKQSTDEKRAVAQTLTDELRDAYDALSRHYELKGLA